MYSKDLFIFKKRSNYLFRIITHVTLSILFSLCKIFFYKYLFSKKIENNLNGLDRNLIRYEGSRFKKKKS